jgi:hypothetical protein
MKLFQLLGQFFAIVSVMEFKELGQFFKPVTIIKIKNSTLNYILCNAPYNIKENELTNEKYI